jgi:hypothetical protein
LFAVSTFVPVQASTTIRHPVWFAPAKSAVSVVPEGADPWARNIVTRPVDPISAVAICTQVTPPPDKVGVSGDAALVFRTDTSPSSFAARARAAVIEYDDEDAWLAVAEIAEKLRLTPLSYDPAVTVKSYVA